MDRLIFNLEFPAYCNSFEIAGYTFKRVENYEEAYKKLYHDVHVTHEFDTCINTGSNQITGVVSYEGKEDEGILEWNGSQTTKLDDVLLFLSFFSGRDLSWIYSNLVDENYLIISDARIANFGNVFRTSIDNDLKIYDEGGVTIYSDHSRVTVIPNMLDCISDADWMKKYENGYFLFLFKSAMFSRTIESAFLQYWTIWEHLYTVLHRDRYDSKTIQKMNSSDKISYILVEYGLKEVVDNSTRSSISKLATIRNRLVHFGKLPEGSEVYDDTIFFIGLTDVVVAKILGLSPSNVFNTLDKLEKF